MEHKTLKFRKDLADMILAGEKDATWRLFDDKDLSEGDECELLIWETLEQFATAHLLDVQEKAFKELTEEDWEGHETFDSDEEMYATYSTYYKQPVGPDTLVKVIKFEIVSIS
jgi:hypothetical protein